MNYTVKQWIGECWLRFQMGVEHGCGAFGWFAPWLVLIAAAWFGFHKP